MSLKYFYIGIILLFLSTLYFAQYKPGARQIALAHSDIALSNDVFSLFNNPAGLAQLNSRQIGIYYSPSPFGLNELANGYIAFTEPTNFGNFNIGAMTYGYNLYKENHFIIGYSNHFLNNFLFGFTAFYNTVKIRRYGNTGQINLSFGGLFLLNKIVSLGFSVHNPLRYSSSKLELPLNYQFGISYIPAGLTSLNFSLSKDIDFPFEFHFGVEYPIIEFLILRVGAQNNPTLYNAGIGLSYSYFRINYSFSSHQELGLTHQFDLIISFE